MTRPEIQQCKRLVKKLRDAQEIANRLEITLGNGGEVDSIIGSIADEIEVRMQESAE